MGQRARQGLRQAQGRVCYGKVVVKDIVRWTEPNNGKVDVTYTIAVIGLLSWVTGPGFEDIAKIMGQDTMESCMPLELTNEGWHWRR